MDHVEFNAKRKKKKKPYRVLKNGKKRDSEALVERVSIMKFYPKIKSFEIFLLQAIAPRDELDGRTQNLKRALVRAKPTTIPYQNPLFFSKNSNFIIAVR